MFMSESYGVWVIIINIMKENSCFLFSINIIIIITGRTRNITIIMVQYIIVYYFLYRPGWDIET